jgi:hypothetical protein
LLPVEGFYLILVDTFMDVGAGNRYCGLCGNYGQEGGKDYDYLTFNFLVPPATVKPCLTYEPESFYP